MRYVLAALVVAVAPAASVASAQGHPQTREGFWIGFGFGYGSLSYSCSGCSGSEGALSGYLKLGGTLSSKLLIGGETNGWTKNDQGVTVTAGNASAVLYFYPNPTAGLFLRGGIGVATLSASGGGGTGSQSGLGVTFGLGYDVRVGTNFSITPVANYNWGDLGSGVKQKIIQVAVGVTWH